MLRTNFAGVVDIEPARRVELLGGKGASLGRMVALGLPVPPGFTLTTEACHTFLAQGWTPELESAVIDGITDLEASTSKRFGDPSEPLLVSVRSGAPISMPGMMDTVLNVGMSPAVAESLGSLTGDVGFGWDTYRRFAQSYAAVVLETPDETIRELLVEHLGTDEGHDLEPAALRDAVTGFVAALASNGYTVPDDAAEQVRSAVRAVFSSWTCERACVYREVEGIDDGLGTGATVQMMAFGNLGERSGTGVAFSRDPSTGAPGIIGDFLQSAQGEDVVAGNHTTLPVSALGDLWPEVAAELDRTAALLERDVTDIVDIEFTVERGSLWLLQVRKGKHSKRAALRMAIDMAEDPDFPLDRTEALDRVAPVLLDPPMIPNPDSDQVMGEVLTTGLAASPGRAIGAICTDVEEAIAAKARGEDVILVRRETSPADVAGMAAAVGIVTSLGGLVSHAAIVARGWQVPAIVGAEDITFVDAHVQIRGRSIPTGTVVTIDGVTGEIFLGAQHTDEIEAPEVAILRGWQRDANDDVSPTAGASTGWSEPVTLGTTGRALALKGMGSAESIGLVLGASADEVTPYLDQLAAAGDAQELRPGTVRALPPLTERIGVWYEEESLRLRSVVEPHMDAFHEANSAFKEVVFDWQMRTVDGQEIANDHTDAEWDGRVIDRLGSEIHTAIEPIVTAIARQEQRIGRYLDRLVQALHAIRAGETDMLAHPFKDSYHTVWFELHEELIRLSGRNRLDEAQAGRA